MITAAVVVDSSDVEGVKCPTFQIWDPAVRRGGGAGGVVTSGLLTQPIVTEGSL